MKIMHAHTIRTRRGSVIVLVVAVLALLAVIGTVYIVSARSERGNATAQEVSYNLDLARMSVINSALRPIADENIGGDGIIASYSTPAFPNYGDQAASQHTMPELGVNPVGPLPLGPGYAYWLFPDIQAASNYYGTHKDHAWLVSNVYRLASLSTADATIAAPGIPGRYNDLSLLTQNGFDPKDGLYDFPYYQNAPGTVPTPTQFPMTVSSLVPTGLLVPSFRVVAHPLPQQFPTPTLGNVEQATDDAFIQLLPYSEASGIRYRFGVRIIDTSRMANLNIGESNPNSNYGLGTYFTAYALGQQMIFKSAADPYYAVGYPDIVDSIDNPASGSKTGRMGSWLPPANPLGTVSNNGAAQNVIAPLDWAWSRQALTFEQPSLALPYDISDEMELRSFGMLGTAYTPRPANAFPNLSAAIWPNTLGNTQSPPSLNVVGNPFRGFFTAYSYSRELRPYFLDTDTFAVPFAAPGQAYTLVPQSSPMSFNSIAAPVVWPPFPARVAAAPDVAYYVTGTAATGDEYAADMLAIAATNIATAMEKIAQYSPQEARAFAANYITYRWNGWTKLPNGSYNLTNGPSFIDDTGICIRATTSAAGPAGTYHKEYGSSNDLRSESHKVYLGFAAQPYITEIAVTEGDPLNKGSKQITEVAVELFNPNDVPLDLSDYKIRTQTSATDVALAGQFIPPHSCFVLVTTGSGLSLNTNTTNPGIAGDALSAPCQKMESPAIQLSELGGKVQLMRKYLGRSNTPEFAAVDTYDYSALVAKALGELASDESFYIRRDHGDLTDPLLTLWSCAVQYPTESVPYQGPGSAPEEMSLGVYKAQSSVAGEKALQLYDHNLSFGPPSFTLAPTLFPFAQRSPLLNIEEFNRIMRITNEVDAATGDADTATASDNGAVSAQLAKIISTPITALAGTQCPADASIHFDFKAPAWMFNSPNAPVDVTAPPSGMKTGDIRAVHLLECLAMVNRVSDPTIDLGDNNTVARGISKLRIPGQINVNTAPGEVLAALPPFNNQVNYKYIGMILAYRWRCRTDDVRIPTAFRFPIAAGSTLYDFTDPSKYPGYGIRSLSELMVPLTLDPFYANALTLDQRDQLWATLYNMCTVRSDTFIVYGYLEAVKANLNFQVAGISTPHNNGTDWYGPVSDDPHNVTAPNIRVARRRFIALIDRSQANFNRLGPTGPTGPTNASYQAPRVIAIKDLPN